jgi:hypothetical protein
MYINTLKSIYCIKKSFLDKYIKKNQRKVICQEVEVEIQKHT